MGQPDMPHIGVLGHAHQAALMVLIASCATPSKTLRGKMEMRRSTKAQGVIMRPGC